MKEFLMASDPMSQTSPNLSCSNRHLSSQPASFWPSASLPAFLLWAVRGRKDAKRWFIWVFNSHFRHGMKWRCCPWVQKWCNVCERVWACVWVRAHVCLHMWVCAAHGTSAITRLIFSGWMRPGPVRMVLLLSRVSLRVYLVLHPSMTTCRNLYQAETPVEDRKKEMLSPFSHPGLSQAASLVA